MCVCVWFPSPRGEPWREVILEQQVGRGKRMAAHTYIYGTYRRLRAGVCRTVRGPTASSLIENSRWVNREACWWRVNTSGDLPHGPVLMVCSVHFEKHNSELRMTSRSRQNSSVAQKKARWMHQWLLFAHGCITKRLMCRKMLTRLFNDT